MKMSKDTRWLFEFSKKVVCVIVALYVLVIIFTCVMVAITLDLGILSSAIESTTKVTVVCLGGYVFKALLENVFKIKSQYMPNYGMIDSYGMNSYGTGGMNSYEEEDIMG